MNIPRFELTKGFDAAVAGPTKDPLTFQARTVDELLSHTLTPSSVVNSWGMGKTLSAALLQGVQGEPSEGVNVKPLVNPDRSLVNSMIPVTYPSQAGRRT
jgi:hypothetical protein